MIRDVHPGPRIRIFFPILDPGSSCQKGTGSRIRIRNTVFLYIGDPDFLKNFFATTKEIGILVILQCLALLDLLILESRLQILLSWSL